MTAIYPALEHAQARTNGYAVGVWEGKRFVANVEIGTTRSHAEARVTGREALRVLGDVIAASLSGSRAGVQNKPPGIGFY